ncbi:hypothetical protein [Streptomyces sp. RLA2-12]|uniref:hypothetical protein n=1 Tax=Streptomyces sp. RLA2-12 TaxID=2721242 RepID=UPI00145F078F|nr:hypothetical protein [Streptomyces sp. RLA2-12]NMI63196.1 hypothetical protein [Streptomyces sp. RLA2-12]
MISLTPPCPGCAATTEPIQMEGEDLFRCPACGRRTYGTGDEDDDQTLPPYSETGEDGSVFIYHGNGEPDFEATAELASQEDPGNEDGLDDEEPDDGPAPAGHHPEPVVRDVRVQDLAQAPGGVWVWVYGDERGWRFLTAAEYDPDRGDSSVVLTFRDGATERAWPWPQARMVRAEPDTVPTATAPGPAGLVRW